MCGIAGVADWSQADHSSGVERQLDCLEHRGPDSRGVYAKPGVALGQTRLAIIDLVTGDPPITEEEGLIAVSLNGEIYNYQALRETLGRDGHKLATTGDTEVIAHLAEDLDAVELARHLHGMFALAVWDERRRRLLLARDPLGKKPLYYWNDGGRLVFGSEIKAVLAHPFVSAELDADVLPSYLTFGYVPTPRTFYAGIQSLPPGHVLTADAKSGVQVERYWEPRIPSADGVSGIDLPLEQSASEVLDRLTAAVERRLVADVPLGAFLSGGVDSSAVVAIMAQLDSRPVHTFTIGFEDEEGFDERPYARVIAERFGTEHVEFVVKPHAVDLVERLVWHHDQPFGDSSAIPTFLLSELTRKHVTVALSGDGGDELFAGYERFAAALALDRYHHLPSPARTALKRASSLVPSSSLGGRGSSLHRFMARAEEAIPDALLAWVRYVPQEWLVELVPGGSEWGVDDYHEKWKASDGGTLLARLLQLNLLTYLLDDLLPKVDRMSMAHGLEVRSPFLDRDLVEFSLRLPASAKIRGLRGKRVLKHALRNLLPREVLHRRKRGFGVPLDRWFRTDLRDYLDAMLGTRTARVRAHLRGEALDRMLAEQQSGKGSHRDSLWTLLTLEVFLRHQGW